MKNLLYIIFTAGIISSCNMPNSNNNAEKNKAGVQAFYDKVINDHNIAMVDSFCAPEFLDHQPDEGFTGKGSADLKAGFTSFFAAFPDIHAKADFMVASGDTVVSKVTMTGTNTGPMMGMPPTNKAVTVEGIDIIRIVNGKAVERWGFFDQVKMMKQMGMMPEMGGKKDSSMTMSGEKK